MQITARDRKLFEVLNRYHVLSSRQLGDLVFKNVAKTNAFRRLRLLEKEKFILRADGLAMGEQAWILRSKGASYLESEWHPYSVNKNTPLHDVTLSRVRLVLESVGLGKFWQSELAIKRETFDPRRRHSDETRLISDGLLTMPGEDQISVWGVELELHLKSKARYQDIFRKYKTTYAINAAWYIVPNKEMAFVLRREWNKCHYDGGTLVISLLPEILLDPAGATLFYDDIETTLGNRAGLYQRNNDDHSHDQGVINESGKAPRAA